MAGCPLYLVLVETSHGNIRCVMQQMIPSLINSVGQKIHQSFFDTSGVAVTFNVTFKVKLTRTGEALMECLHAKFGLSD